MHPTEKKKIPVGEPFTGNYNYGFTADILIFMEIFMTRNTREEFINAITHGLGAILSILALIIMVYTTVRDNRSMWHITSFTIYGASLVLLYLSSTLYHSFFKFPKVHALLKIFDHSAIYLLIAGTYTPFLLVPLHGPIGTQCAIIIWSIAGIGILLKLFYAQRFKILSTLCYLAMGWMIIFYVKPLLATIPENAFLWLLAGGFLYTAGAVFYLWKKLPYSHSIWHLFVMGGSAAHFIAIFYYIRFLPLPTA